MLMGLLHLEAQWAAAHVETALCDTMAVKALERESGCRPNFNADSALTGREAVGSHTKTSLRMAEYVARHTRHKQF